MSELMIFQYRQPDVHGIRPFSGSSEADEERFTVFVDQVFRGLPCIEQRMSAASYLRGVLTTEGRKSINRIGESLGLSATARHSLRHFVNDSPWDWGGVRNEIVRWIERVESVRAWVFAPVFMPKRGAMSVGVHKAFVPVKERTMNCQIGIGLFLAAAGRTIPVDWRLVLPREWIQDGGLRSQHRCFRASSLVRASGWCEPGT
ncbi:transposase, partial [Streptomonospora salina]